MRLPFKPKKPTEPTGSTGPTGSTESGVDGLGDLLTTAPAEEAAPTSSKRRFRHVRALFAPAGRVLAKIPHPPWRSKRGIFVLFVLFAGFGAVAGVGGMTAISFSETPGFCGMCHTMDPELKAYAMSPHKDVTCAECHINPGLGGFIKAKANGSKQLLHILTGAYPTPIEPPDHAAMPPVKFSCLKCHEKESLNANGGTTRLVLRARYKPDAVNTKQTLALLLRPAGLGQDSGTAAAGAPVDSAVKGVHWHIEQTVTYTTSDIASKKIDLVSIKETDGTTAQYIAGQQVAVSTDVNPDVDRLKTSETTKTMDCIDCHNRIGHGVPSPDRSVDDAMAAGKISTSLPYIKRNAVALLNGVYASEAAANTAISGLRTTYEKTYPLVVEKQSAQITAAIAELKVQYALIATPAMKVQAKTYPDNLGHQTSLGCFRCHDGAHYLVVKGQITNKTIPSACGTCHTFPQVGDNPAAAPTFSSGASSFPLGARPATHKDRLYIFSHKNSAGSVNPAGTSCGTCHTPSYCSNCHKSGAIKITHNNMLYNHAAAVTAAGGTQACAYCHLPVYCQKCHKGPVLDTTNPPARLTGTKAP